MSAPGWMGHTQAQDGHWTRRYQELPPTFHCFTKECPQLVYDVDDMKKCEGCSERFCADCLVSLDGTLWCKGCRVCVACDKAATKLVEGELVCKLHESGIATCGSCEGTGEHEVEGREEDTGYANSITCGFCGGEGWVRLWPVTQAVAA